MFRALFAFLFGCFSGLTYGQAPSLCLATVDSIRLEPILQEYKGGTWTLAADALCLGKRDKNSLLRHLWSRGYLLASIDSLQARDSTETGLLFLGPELKWVKLGIADDIPDDWLRAARFRKKKYRNEILHHASLMALEARLLDVAEDKGYPFARVGLDSIRFEGDDRFAARLSVDRGPRIHFSNLRIVGDLNLPARFLPQYLNILPGMTYSRSRVLGIRQQLSALPYLELTGNPSVTFAGDEATVNVFARKKRVGRFDFIIGLLPRPNDDAGRLLLTGSLDAAFQNALNQGERFALSFERLRPETQKMNLETAFPYVLGTTFGTEGKLHIFRRDSSWVDAQSELSLQYLFGANNFLKLLWENRSSTLQKIDSVAIIRDRRLPLNLDYRQNGFGLELDISRLDYPLNPRKGWQFRAKTVAGLHQIKRNSQIEALRNPADSSFIGAALYDQLPELNTARFRVECVTGVFFPLFQRSTLRVLLQAGAVFSKGAIYLNEQYRLGGNKRLRGFDEESLPATQFALATLEYRLIVGKNAYMSAFSDYAYIENISRDTRLFFRPLGLGVGFNIETAAGIFGISAAVGRQNPDLGIDFRASKFHIGYVNLF